MFLSGGHIADSDSAANAVMSEVFAAQCKDSAANAVMSEVFAMQCNDSAANAIMSEVFAMQSGARNKSIYHRYC